ncbi:MAG: hypothetical protein H0V24_04015, partial [Chloroflexia bacterium]|nr:hypothetical protein [Chloroflexia bacterium]
MTPTPTSSAADNGRPLAIREVVVHQGPALLAILAIAAIYTLIARDSGLGPGILIP